MFSKGILASLFLLSHLYPVFAMNRFLGLSKKPASGLRTPLLEPKADESVGSSSQQVSSASEVFGPDILWVHRNDIFTPSIARFWIGGTVDVNEEVDIVLRDQFFSEGSALRQLRDTFKSEKKEKKVKALSKTMTKKIDQVLKALQEGKEGLEQDLRAAYYIQELCAMSSSRENPKVISQLIRQYVSSQMEPKIQRLPEDNPTRRMYGFMQKYLQKYEKPTR